MEYYKTKFWGKINNIQWPKGSSDVAKDKKKHLENKKTSQQIRDWIAKKKFGHSNQITQDTKEIF